MKEYWECNVFGLKVPSSCAEILDIPSCRLGSLLKKKEPDDSCIDFMTVDGEGNEPEVLKNNNWAIHSPSETGIALNINSYEICSYLNQRQEMPV